MTKTYFGLPNPPVRLAKITIGDGTMANLHVCHDLPAVAVIETFPQLISYDPEVLAYFKKQSELCGYNVTLEYPQNGLFPTINPPDPVGLSAAERQARNFLSKRYLNKRALTPGHNTPEGDITPLQKKEFNIHQQWKKDLSQRANGTIDPFYGCFLQQELIDYAFNFSLPWNASGDINIYFVPDALNPERPLDGTVFLNDNTTRAAIHAPTSKDWSPGLSGSGYPFGGPDGTDPSPEYAQMDLI
ncbi:hypothetical protein QCA50_011057 [Cerrena zonata]|uniref:Uncharacterized protein n=1 Tax=Cerrena zonata TaxID=2478898 RepID=A0AAW0G6V9_9APHY